MFKRVHDSPNGFPVFVDGMRITAYPGEMVAGVLLRTAPFIARTTPVKASPRAPFCMMGVCFDCLAVVDGMQSVQTCQTPVREGMTITRQHGPWEVSA